MVSEVEEYNGTANVFLGRELVDMRDLVHQLSLTLAVQEQWAPQMPLKPSYKLHHHEDSSTSCCQRMACSTLRAVKNQPLQRSVVFGSAHIRLAGQILTS